MKEIIYVKTNNPNFDWDAGGKGISAHSSAWVIFEKSIDKEKRNYFRVVEMKITTTTATGNHRSGCPFADGAQYFEDIWKKIKGKYFSCKLLPSGLVHNIMDFSEPTLDEWINSNLQEEARS